MSQKKNDRKCKLGMFLSTGLEQIGYTKLVSSESGSIGYVTCGCNKKSRGCKPEPKPVTMAIYKRKSERGLRELVSIREVVIVFSCQPVLATFHAGEA